MQELLVLAATEEMLEKMVVEEVLPELKVLDLKVPDREPEEKKWKCHR